MIQDKLQIECSVNDIAKFKKGAKFEKCLGGSVGQSGTAGHRITMTSHGYR